MIFERFVSTVYTSFLGFLWEWLKYQKGMNDNELDTWINNNIGTPITTSLPLNNNYSNNNNNYKPNNQKLVKINKRRCILALLATWHTELYPSIIPNRQAQTWLSDCQTFLHRIVHPEPTTWEHVDQWIDSLLLLLQALNQRGGPTSSRPSTPDPDTNMQLQQWIRRRWEDVVKTGPFAWENAPVEIPSFPPHVSNTESDRYRMVNRDGAGIPYPSAPAVDPEDDNALSPPEGQDGSTGTGSLGSSDADPYLGIAQQFDESVNVSEYPSAPPASYDNYSGYENYDNNGLNYSNMEPNDSELTLGHASHHDYIPSHDTYEDIQSPYPTQSYQYQTQSPLDFTNANPYEGQQQHQTQYPSEHNYYHHHHQQTPQNQPQNQLYSSHNSQFHLQSMPADPSHPNYDPDYNQYSNNDDDVQGDVARDQFLSITNEHNLGALNIDEQKNMPVKPMPHKQTSRAAFQPISPRSTQKHLQHQQQQQQQHQKQQEQYPKYSSQPEIQLDQTKNLANKPQKDIGAFSQPNSDEYRYSKKSKRYSQQKQQQHQSQNLPVPSPFWQHPKTDDLTDDSDEDWNDNLEEQNDYLVDRAPNSANVIDLSTANERKSFFNNTPNVSYISSRHRRSASFDGY